MTRVQVAIARATAKNAPMPIPEKLPGKQLRHLRSMSHGLKPIVQVGKHGWTDAIRVQLDGALLDHELIKIRVGSEAPLSAKELGLKAAEGLSAHVAQTIGSTLVLYRAHPKKPVIKLPRVKVSATDPEGE